ncbi:Histone deacetylase interacting [Cynara cardunculus var. scolymus]|uniref:Histone deacetylase interacting n=1 Tax=Cynara cardunculus var. scolymus TaxID=59895 RepID=A0A118JZL0_CYNCS|nr:Histone deacetylase interacting [Cynara cardunculus var. scolymus]
MWVFDVATRQARLLIKSKIFSSSMFIAFQEVRNSHEGSQSSFQKKYQEKLSEFEDKRYEIDMALECVKLTIRWLKSMALVTGGLKALSWNLCSLI